MNNEIWKDVKGFEGFYQVSNLGRLKSFKKDPGGYILSNKNSKGGYLSVVLSKVGLRKSLKLHRIVAEAFIPNPDNKREVNHINMVKSDNRMENLEWSTPSQNIRHAVENKPSMIAGMVKYNNERPDQIVQKSLSGNIIAIFKNAVLAAKETGVCRRNILQVAAQTEYKPGLIRKQAGGYIWEKLTA